MGFSLLLSLIALSSVDPAKLLQSGIERFRSLDDEGATAALRQALAASPAAPLAAKAHLYLGLIALNNSDITKSREEFKAALVLDALLELPADASPKARFIYRQARAELEANPGAAILMQPAPQTAAPAEPPITPGVTAVEAVPDRLPGLIAGAGAVAVLAVGIGFGVKQNGDFAATTNSKNNALQIQAAANAVPTDGLIADLCFAGAAALGITGAILFFAVHKSPDGAPAVTIAPTAGGARLVFESRF